MTWLACLIVVLGIGMAFGCCCDGVCLDCTSDQVDSLTVAITYAGVIQSGGTNEFCSGSATTCEAGWNGTHMLPYLSGVGTTTCDWQLQSATYPGDCLGDAGRRFYFSVVAPGIVELTTNSDYLTSIGGAFFEYDHGGDLTCDFNITLSLTSTNSADGFCDHVSATASAADV